MDSKALLRAGKSLNFKSLCSEKEVKELFQRQVVHTSADKLALESV
jgi:hypothetical protein